MKRFFVVLGMIVSTAGGVAIGILWERGNRATYTEDVAADEFRLLEKHRLTPTCAQIQSATHEVGETKSPGATILWRLLPEQGQLARVVVADDLTVAYETTENPCVKRSPSKP
jgi:hypothetical protein